jgi:hypothetical protein
MCSDRLKAFTVEELHALMFRLNVAETVEPLDELSTELRDEMIRELKEQDDVSLFLSQLFHLCFSGNDDVLFNGSD